ncbi:hypothetical protein TNCV_3286541 [Trichonephila clavipes]|nr:hypothetical protein TNCV_3286541 [Trichonephila clavipes]
MDTVDFLYHENSPTWAGVEPTTIGVEGQRQTNHATQPALEAILETSFFSLERLKGVHGLLGQTLRGENGHHKDSGRKRHGKVVSQKEHIPYDNLVLLVEFTLCCPGTHAAVEKVFSVEGEKVYNDDHKDEITDFVQSIPGFQECDEDIETWMAIDADSVDFKC